MTDSAEKASSQVASILAIGVPGYSILHLAERARIMTALKKILHESVEVRVAERAGKLRQQPAEDGVILIFADDPEGPIRCAVEISGALKRQRPEISVRMGIHTAQLRRDGASQNQSNGADKEIDMARRVMDFGDAGHILLSRRAAYEIASAPRWSEHLYDLDEYTSGENQAVPLVIFFSEEAGSGALPAKLEKKAEEPALPPEEKKRAPIWGIAIRATSVVILSALTAAAFVFLRRPLLSTSSSQPVFPAIEQSVAVLPFADLSSGRDQEYFCDGVSEEILDDLSQIPGLRVTSRTSAFSFKGRTIEESEIGQKLGVTAVLEGTVRREGDAVRIAMQLVSTRDSAVLWSKSVECDVSGLFAVKEGIRTAVADAFKLVLKPGRPRRALSNTLAYDLYLQGLYLSHKSSEEDLRTSIDFFRLALEKDPKLAGAWTGTARDWLRLADAYVRPLDAYPKVEEAASNALIVDEQDAEAHVYLGEAKRVLAYDLNSEETELKRALALNPNLVTAHLFSALSQSFRGNPAEARQEIERAVQLDPLSPIVSSWEVNINVAAERFDEAFSVVKRTMEIDPNYVYFESALALVYREEGKLNEALDIYLRLEKTRRQVTPALGLTYARLGRREEAQRILERLIRTADTKYFPAEQIASIYVALGEKDKAFGWLERAITEHSGPIHEIGFAREFRPLRSDPRFTDILQRIGLDPSKFPAGK